MSIAEQRTFPRSELNQAIHLWHPQAGRLYPVKILNHSKSGVLIAASMRCPLRQGQYVQLQFTPAESFDDTRTSPEQLARVMRVDRTQTLEDASIKAGLMFSQDPE